MRFVKYFTISGESIPVGLSVGTVLELLFMLGWERVQSGLGGLSRHESCLWLLFFFRYIIAVIMQVALGVVKGNGAISFYAYTGMAMFAYRHFLPVFIEVNLSKRV